jgi:large subunit ribosomal protein L10
LAITRQKKQELVADYLARINQAPLIVITDYRGLTMKQMQELRRSLAPLGASFQVTKNTLLRLALQEAGRPVPDRLLEGPTAVSYCFGDVAATAKTMGDFARSSGVLQIRGGLLSRQVLDAEAVRALANLPSREALIAQMLAGMQGPIAGLVNVLGGTLRGLINVLDARRRQLETVVA